MRTSQTERVRFALGAQTTTGRLNKATDEIYLGLLEALKVEDGSEESYRVSAFINSENAGIIDIMDIIKHK